MTTTIPRTFGQQLAIARNEFGCSAYRLSVRTGLDPSYISRLQSDERNPTPETVRAIADALGCTEIERDRLLVLAGHMPDGDVLRKIIYLSLWGDCID